MENLESLLVARALEFCNGNQVHTAKLLGITRVYCVHTVSVC